MLLIEDDTLVHVDSASDILEHYGVKGMKWGVRKAIEKVKNGFKKVGDNHVKNIEYSYRRRGFSEDEVQRRTKRRIKAEKIALGAAAAGLAIYGGYRLGKHIRDDYMEDNLKGQTIRTILNSDDLDLNRDFYAARKKDFKGYRYGWGVNKQAEGSLFGKDTNVFNVKIDKDLKVAPRDKAFKTFKNLMENDKEFRAEVLTKASLAKDGVPHGRKQYGALLKGKINKDAYDAFNMNYQSTRGGANEKFQNALKKQGYGGIVDQNDYKFKTTPNAKHRPVIIFDSKDKVKVDKEKFDFDLENKDDLNGLGKHYGQVIFETYAPKFAKVAGAAALVKAGMDHKTNTEIREMYEPKPKKRRKRG